MRSRKNRNVTRFTIHDLHEALTAVEGLEGVVAVTTENAIAPLFGANQIVTTKVIHKLVASGARQSVHRHHQFRAAFFSSLPWI